MALRLHVPACTLLALIQQLVVFVRADLPVHCLRHQVAGDWEFILGPQTPKRSSCGHSRPDSPNSQPPWQFIASQGQTSTLKVSLQETSHSSTASLEDGTSGTWTMIYDEGFEVAIGDQVYFAFSKFEFVDDGNGQQTNISHCDETQVGWYHTTARNSWGCYYAKKTTAVDSAPSVSTSSATSSSNSGTVAKANAAASGPSTATGAASQVATATPTAPPAAAAAASNDAASDTSVAAETDGSAGNSGDSAAKADASSQAQQKAAVDDASHQTTDDSPKQQLSLDEVSKSTSSDDSAKQVATDDASKSAATDDAKSAATDDAKSAASDDGSKQVSGDDSAKASVDDSTASSENAASTASQQSGSEASASASDSSQASDASSQATQDTSSQSQAQSSTDSASQGSATDLGSQTQAPSSSDTGSDQDSGPFPQQASMQSQQAAPVEQQSPASSGFLSPSPRASVGGSSNSPSVSLSVLDNDWTKADVDTTLFPDQTTQAPPAMMKPSDLEDTSVDQQLLQTTSSTEAPAEQADQQASTVDDQQPQATDSSSAADEKPDDSAAADDSQQASQQAPSVASTATAPPTSSSDAVAMATADAVAARASAEEAALSGSNAASSIKDDDEVPGEATSTPGPAIAPLEAVDVYPVPAEYKPWVPGNSNSGSAGYDKPMPTGWQQSVADALNLLQLGWKAVTYHMFKGKTPHQLNRFAGVRRSRPDKHHLPMQPNRVASNQASLRLEAKKEGFTSFLGISSRVRHASSPESFDWRNNNGRNWLENVVTQGDCGSCYTISTVRMLTARNRIKKGDPNEPAFSITFPLYCSEYNQGCDGGYGFLQSKWAEDVGLVPEKCAPFVESQTSGKCNALPNCDLGDRRYRAVNHHYVGGFYGASEEGVIRQELVNNGPLVMSFEPKEDFMYYKSGIYRSGPNKIHQEWEQVDHAVLLAGYGAEKGQQYWTLQNSWGPDWGEKGHFRMARGVDESGCESIVVSADVLEESSNEVLDDFLASLSQ